MDGGNVTAASFGIVDTDGKWIVENEGVAPDHEVVETPANTAGGRDPQLEKAVELALEAMKTWKYDEVPVLQPPTPR
jgi:tricorn protease